MPSAPPADTEKTEKLDPDSREYRRLEIQAALAFCPPIRPCRECGGPVVKGYCCNRCDSCEP